MPSIKVCDLCGEQIPDGTFYRVFFGPIGGAEDTAGRNDQFVFHGKVGPDGRSCYAAFLDTMDEALGRIGHPESFVTSGNESPANAERQAHHRIRRENEEIRARHEAWKATAGEQRQRLILEALGVDKLSITQIAHRLTDRHRDEYGKVFDTTIRGEVRNMLIRGDLDRERDDDGRKRRYVYFRRAGLSGPIADLQAMLDREAGGDRG